MSGVWVFDLGEPEVPFTVGLGHDCKDDGNVAGAYVTDNTFVAQPGRDTVNEIVTVECEACAATTTTVDTWPRWMFDEGVHLPDEWE